MIWGELEYRVGGANCRPDSDEAVKNPAQEDNGVLGVTKRWHCGNRKLSISVGNIWPNE
ncbi:MAG: hypothetical protein ABGY96_15790 [bacterium]